MNVYQACVDTSDAIELFLPQNLYLKPIARLNISVQLPLLKVPGKSISNWEVMEKVRNIIKPDEFSSLKVSKSTLEFVRLEAEIDNKGKIVNIMSKLDSRTIKLSGFTDVLKVRAAEAKIPYPTRHMWDSYFRDSKHMNDIKPGERPDTIHICNLPSKWFTDKLSKSDGRDMPSEYIFKKVFEAFGEVRCVDIPMLDPLRNAMKNTSGINTFYFGQDHSFEGFVQFKEYVCFVKAMTALKGMKLLYKDGDKAWTANIKVDFDKTKHLSDESIRKRIQERERILLERKMLKEEEERKLREIEERRKEEESLKIQEEEAKAAREKQLIEEKLQRKEIRRKEKELLWQKQLEEEERNNKLTEEKIALAQETQRIKCRRLLAYLLDRARVRLERELILRKKEELLRRIQAEKERKKEMEAKEMGKVALINKEKELREKLLAKYKAFVQKKLESEERKIKKLIEAKKRVLMSSAVECHPCDTYEMDQIFTDEEDYSASEKSRAEVRLPDFSSLGIEHTRPTEEPLPGKRSSSSRKRSDRSRHTSHDVDALTQLVRQETLEAVNSSSLTEEILSDKYLGGLTELCQGYLRSNASNVYSPTEPNTQSDHGRELDNTQTSRSTKRKGCEGDLPASKGGGKNAQFDVHVKLSEQRK